MKMTPGLTKPYDDDMQAKIANTPEGMAHWAGTGPERTTCRECVSFQENGYYAAGSAKGSNQLKPGKCKRFRAMMGRVGPAFRAQTASCRFFDENPHAPDFIYRPGRFA